MSRQFVSNSLFEPNCAQHPLGAGEQTPFQHDAPDPVYMEIEHLAYQIRQTGATEILVKKMSTSLRAYEAIVRMEKRLVHARLEANLARIDALHRGVIPQPEAEKAEEQPTVQEENEPDIIDYETQELIDDHHDNLYSLPKLEDRKFIIPFCARFTKAYRELSKIDMKLRSSKEETAIANKVFMKVVDILELEWLQYVKDNNVDHTPVCLSVIADFLQEEALKEASKMPLQD